MSTVHEIFDPTTPLPTGITAIEASAGTGKTYQITNFLVRLIAGEGLPIDSVLVVTFTKAATAELRDRVRRRIGQAIAALETGEAPAGDDLLRHLAALPEPARGKSLEHLVRAREDFDAAAIMTIHGFCRAVLQENAFEAHVDMEAELVDGPGPVLSDLVDDWLSRNYHAAAPNALRALNQLDRLTPERLRAIARAAAEGRGLAILPTPHSAGPEGLEARRVSVARAGLAAWRERGREALIAAARAADLSSIFKINKNGALSKSLVARLEAIEAELGAAAEGTELPKNPFCFEELEAKWPALDPETIPGLPALKALRDVVIADFLAAVTTELPERMAHLQRRSFGDLLDLLGQTIEADPDGPLVRSLRDRYRAVLIDEFQDTDATQWTIFHTVFGRREAPHLYLIGDPKQAIYAFRNADVHVYLQARSLADADATMDVNQRSDGRLVHATNALFADKDRVFQQEGLAYQPVEAAERHGWSDRVTGPVAAEAPLVIRWVDARASARTADLQDPTAIADKRTAERLVTRLVAADVEALLHSGSTAGGQPVHAGQVAVLVRTHREGEAVKEALRGRGIPAITSATGDVLGSDEARDVMTWLEALREPSRPGPTRALALTPLGGWQASELLDVLDAGGSGRWAAWLADLQGRARELASRGFAFAFGRPLNSPDTLRRIAGLEDGERRLTNYRHLLELVQRAAIEGRLNVDGLLRWMRDRRAGSDEPEESQLRLESDARAVRIVTLHRSKGLQYPFVFIPYLWTTRTESGSDYLRYHKGQEAILDARQPPTPEAKAAHAREQMQETLRLLYVGITRAEHQATLYWALYRPGQKAKLPNAPLTQVLFGDDPEPDQDRAEAARARLEAAIDDPEAARALEARLDALCARATRDDGEATIAAPRPAPPPPPRGPITLTPDAAAALEAPTRLPDDFAFESTWGRHSFTSMTRHSATPSEALAADPDLALRDAEDDAGDAHTHEEAHAPIPPDAPELPLGAFPRGPKPGIFVHHVLEHLDFQTCRERDPGGRELSDFLAAESAREGRFHPADLELLARQLPAILSTPLGAGGGGICLGDIATSDRLDELSFDLALRGGDLFSGDPVRARAFKAIFCRERPAGSPVPRDYLERVRAPGYRLPDMAGFLTGSIDLTYRVGSGPEQRWYLCDYKTNWLRTARPGGGWRCTSHHYAPSRLAAEMAHHDYFVQYHLYLVALHLYLSQRLPGYDIDRNLGGAVYAFVRGMEGPSTPAGHAVFCDRPPSDLIVDLAALLSDTAPTGGPR